MRMWRVCGGCRMWGGDVTYAGRLFYHVFFFSFEVSEGGIDWKCGKREGWTIKWVLEFWVRIWCQTRVDAYVWT